MKYEYEVLKVGDADAILIRHYIGNELMNSSLY